MENEILTQHTTSEVEFPQPETPSETAENNPVTPKESSIPSIPVSQQSSKAETKKKNLQNLAVLAIGISAFILLGAWGISQSQQPTAEPVVNQPTVIISASESDVDKEPVKNVATTVEDIVADTMPALVSISAIVEYTENYMFFGPQTITGEASGSGFIVKIDNKEISLLTNAHVIEDARTVTITFNDESQHEAIVKSCDKKADLAVLSVDVTQLSAETLQQIKCVTLGDSDTLRLGQSVIAIGNALGYGQSVTTGVVSALNRTMTGEDGTTHTWIQTDAAINAGNSGGVLLDMNGRVVGINEAKIADAEVEGMGFAIPITYALSTIDQLDSVEAKFPVAEENRGKLGISCVEVGAQNSAIYGMPQGILIREVTEGSGSAAAGLLANDIITHVDKNETATMNALSTILAYCEKGQIVEVVAMRNNNGRWTEMTFTVTLQ